MTETSKSSEKNKKTTQQTPCTIEEVFNQASAVNSSTNNTASLKPVLLTPRSAELCLKLGLNPEVLKIRDIDSFWEGGIDPAIQRMRHEAYVQRRHDLMKQCRQERKRLMNLEFEAATTAVNQSTTMTPEMILEQQREAGATLIKLELARIEKMQKRQEKELEQMIQFEVNRAKIQQQMADKIEAEKKKEEMKLKQQEKRLKLIAEERRLRELQRQAMEDAEEENRRNMAREMHEKEMELKAAREKKMLEDKKRARQLDMEKKAKNEEARLAVQRYFEEEQMALRSRLETMHVAEEKKMASIMARQQEHAKQLKMKRDMIEQRLAKNMEVSQLIQEQRKEAFMKKQEEFEQARQEHLRRQEEERRLHSQEILLQEQRRRMILLEKRKEEEKKSEEMLIKFEEDEKFVEQVQAIAQHEHQLVKEKKAIKTQMKLENVERVANINEFKRVSTLKKIEDVDKRVKTMLEQKQALIQDRRKASASTKLQKEAITKVMEEVRTNASMAAKLISKAMSGQLDIKEFAKGGLNKTSTKRDRSRSPTSINERLTKSSGDIQGALANHEFFNSTNASTDVPEQKPYVSPYESF
jgi:hypothetical protein